MSFFERITGRDRSGDSRRQVRSSANDFHDDWADEPKSISGDYESPSDTKYRKQREEERATSNRMSSEADAHEKRTGLPATFMPNVSRIAPEGTSQSSHDASLQRAHDAMQSSKGGGITINGEKNVSAYSLSSRASSGTHFDVYEHPQDTASTYLPRHSATIKDPKITSVTNRDGLGSTPHLEGSLHTGGGRYISYSKPLSEVYSLESSSHQPDRPRVSDQSNEAYRN